MFSMVTREEEAIKVLQDANAISVVIFGLEVGITHRTPAF